MDCMSSDEPQMTRRPPADVRRQLAEEVGFGCPVEGCGSPYLMWHHFDPPWATKHHQDPNGMVALCRDHHPEADKGAFTTDQLREFKRVGRDRSKALGARFNWMRDELLAIVGGNFFYQTPVAVQLNNTPIVWFNRDNAGRLLVNLRMPTTSNEPRIVMLDNFWMTEGASEGEIICPPSGSLVSAKYPNGDQLNVEFKELATLDDLDQRLPRGEMPAAVRKRLEAAGIAGLDQPQSHAETVKQFEIIFPITTVEITMKVGGTDLSFGPKHTSIATNTIVGGWMKGCAVGLQIGDPSASSQTRN
jgi:hypothetical protein